LTHWETLEKKKIVLLNRRTVVSKKKSCLQGRGFFHDTFIPKGKKVKRGDKNTKDLVSSAAVRGEVSFNFDHWIV